MAVDGDGHKENVWVNNAPALFLLGWDNRRDDDTISLSKGHVTFRGAVPDIPTPSFPLNSSSATSPHTHTQSSFTNCQTPNMPIARPSKGEKTRAMARQALTDITPPVESGAVETYTDATHPDEPEPKEPPNQSWDSPCVSKICPIKHPHNFGLRPPTLLTPFVICTDPDEVTAGNDDHAYPDTEPPPLIKVMIDTLRYDPLFKVRYPHFMDVLRDFYRAHGGRSNVYHGPGGMLGLGEGARVEAVS